MARSSLLLVQKAGWSVVDQGLSALSNVVLSVLVARSVDAASFGAFAIAFVVFSIAVAVTKSVVGQPLQIRFSASGGATLHAALQQSFGLALALGLVAGAGCAVAGLLLPGVTGQALLALAVVLPGLLVQDTCRMALFAIAQPARAALIDAVWAVVQFGLLALLIVLGHPSLELLILAWGVAALMSAGLGLSLLRALPRPTRAWSWIRDQHSLTRYLLAEYVLGLGAFQLGILLVGVIANASALGALRAAQVLLGPLAVLGAGAIQFAVPEVARRRLSASQSTRAAVLVSAAMGVATALYVLVVLVIARPLGHQLFGDSWAGAAPVLLPMALSSFFSTLGTGPAVVLIGMGQAKRTYRLNLVKAPVQIVSLAVATWFAGAVGAAWALAATEALMLPLWIGLFRRVLPDLEPGSSDPGSTGSGSTGSGNTGSGNTGSGSAGPDSRQAWFDEGR